MTGSIEETDVVVIGSGFGGSVAALRFADAGHSVVVLERGDRPSREKFQADVDFFWRPERNAYGFHDVRPRGDGILPWVGAAVGGGSHVYAGTLKRREGWAGFPAAIRETDMGPYFARAEDILDASPYPDWEPYAGARATRLMARAGAKLAQERPDVVEKAGWVRLAISFAPPGGTPGATFTNKHGCEQRTFDPTEQSLLGGDLDAKNTLDRNYLYLAEHAARPASIRPLCEVDQIEPLLDGRYRVSYVRRSPAPRGLPNLRRRYLPFRPPPDEVRGEIIARRVVIAAGAVGSTELLLRNRDVHRTLPDLGAPLGERYTTNGDHLSLLVDFRGFWLSWLGFIALVILAAAGQWLAAAAAALAYYAGLVVSGPPSDPDVGTTNIDYIRFKGRDGGSQGAYLESGRYPTPLRLVLAVLVSAVTGHLRPARYRTITWITRLMGWLPPFGALARTYPIPLLGMGRDDAVGRFSLDANGRARIHFDAKANRAHYDYLDELGRLVGRAAGARWLPNFLTRLTGQMEIPHNQGGVPMGETPADGVVDHAGRVFGHPNLLVLDGSTIPVSVGPNPALTILAVSERAMEVVLAQLATDGVIRAETERPVLSISVS